MTSNRERKAVLVTTLFFVELQIEKKLTMLVELFLCYNVPQTKSDIQWQFLTEFKVLYKCSLLNITRKMPAYKVFCGPYMKSLWRLVFALWLSGNHPQFLSTQFWVVTTSLTDPPYNKTKGQLHLMAHACIPFESQQNRWLHVTLHEMFAETI